MIVCLGVAVAAPSSAHPTDQELREAQSDRKRCGAPVPHSNPIDPVSLGMTSTELKAAVANLRAAPPAMSEVDTTRGESGLTRWTREATGDLAFVEYELWQDRVFLIRWKLDARFERPVFEELVRRARICFGRPDYDQKFEAEPGTPKATLRRVGWTHREREIDLRQLHPLRGGPVYLSVNTKAVPREIVAARVTLYPPPDQSKPWWERSMAPPVPATAEEREQLGSAFLGLLSELDH